MESNEGLEHMILRRKAERAAGFALKPEANPALMGCYRKDGATLSTYKLQLVRY